MPVHEYASGIAVDEPLEDFLQSAVSGAVKKALPVIWEGRFHFTFQPKEGMGDRKKDFYTSVDEEAQAVVVDFLRPRFREYGFLCEEDGVEAWKGEGPYFTVDALDGTLPFMHGNLHAVSSMVAAVREGVVEAVCIGDVTTQETYSYGPTSASVALTCGAVGRLLPRSPAPVTDVGTCCALLRRPLAKHRPVVQRLIEAMGDHQISGESLGVWAPRLWKREFQVAVLWHGSKVTPWDMTPIIGISQKLDYVFLRSTDGGEALEEYEPSPPIHTGIRGEDVVIIHRNDLHAIEHLVRH